jgi:hypothetical protein
MKKFKLLLWLVLLLPLTFYAQNIQSLGITTGVGWTNLDLKKVSNISGRGSFNLGLYYAISLTDHLAMESGINYQNNGIHTPKHNICGVVACTEIAAHTHRKTNWSVPIHLKVRFWKQFYVNGGVIFDEIEDEIDLFETYGIGLGYDYPLSESWSLAFNPYYNSYNYDSYRIKDLSMRLITKRHF